MFVRKFVITIVMVLLLVNVPQAHPGKIVQSVPLSAKYATGMCYDGNNLWIADHREDKIFQVIPGTGDIIKTIPSPGYWPAGLAWDGEALWNVDQKQKKIYRIDPSDGRILNSIDAPTSDPDGLTWDGHTLWTGDVKRKVIMKLDLSDGTAIHKLDAPASTVQGLTFDGRYLWCADRLSDEIYMLEPENGEVILILNSPGKHPRGLAWDGKYIWNVDYETDHLYKLIKNDDELYVLKDRREAKITLTQEISVAGEGQLREMQAYISIPENMPQQIIKSVTFIPEVTTRKTDKWGQNIAQFTLEKMSPGERLSLEMIVEAEVSDIHYFVLPENCGRLADIPPEIVEKYTADGTKYDIQNPFIQKKVREIVGAEDNPYWIARKIFDYVGETLEYKLEGGWNIAPYVLQRGTGSCSEYTFSFIALCRAAGLPSRYVGSLVVRGDDASIDEVFHRWPEVYLPNYGWIPIDPQGGDKPLPRDRAKRIGQLSNRFLITTQGGGDSQFLGWYYVSQNFYQADPKALVNIDQFADWEPLDQSEK